MAGRILVGTCNWSDHQNFYPRGLPARERLAHYAKFFPLVEIDTSYYAIPGPDRTGAWAASTPDDFSFNIKAYRALTYHEREGGTPREPTGAEEREFAQALEPLRASGKLKAIHYQFPPWFTANPRNLERLARVRERHPDDLLVVELRHQSWVEGERPAQLADLLREARISLCTVDEPQLGSGSFPTATEVTDSRLALVRFHGRNWRTWYSRGKSSADRFDYLYQPPELAGWVPRVRELAECVDELHLLFNNNRSNYAVVNGLQMAELLDLGLPGPGSVPPRAPAAVEEPDLPLAPGA
ncbi:MAG: DUF72 domain-containing protein [Candidatus Dormibacteria bacterium]